MAQLELDLFVKARKDASLEYGVKIKGSVRAKSQTPSKYAAILASQFLVAATDAFALTDKPFPEGNEPDFMMSIIQPTTVSVAPDNTPGHEQRKIALFGFGDTHLGISLHPDAARQFAETLLAFCADGTPQ